jgi:hypothetical protein
LDCAGDCFGSAVIDECGECNGVNIDCFYDEIDCSCEGCTDENACNYDGVFATIDNGSCNFADENYDCDDNCIAGVDCAGECGGSLVLDDCEICNGANAPNTGICDCDGVPDGDNVVDICGMCDNDSSNDCVQDCNGIWGGIFLEDNCGTCDIDPSNDCLSDCAAEPGGTAELDDCEICDNYPSTDGNPPPFPYGTCDCNGTPSGTVFFDECGVCGGSGIIDGKCDCGGNVLDCFDACGGSAIIDQCGECNGDNSSGCLNNDCDTYCDCDGTENDCAGECGGSAVLDECGECGGSGPDVGYNCAGECIIGEDCAFECGGTHVEDACGVCVDGPGDGSSSDYLDGCGECHTDPLCTGYGDCNGAWNGCGGCQDVHAYNGDPDIPFDCQLADVDVVGQYGCCEYEGCLDTTWDNSGNCPDEFGEDTLTGVGTDPGACNYGDIFSSSTGAKLGDLDNAYNLAPVEEENISP